MDTISKRYIWIFFIIMITAMAGAYLGNIVSTPESKPILPNDNITAEAAAYVTVRDTEGNVILETGIPVYEEDEYINENNIHYIIISIEGSNAVARVKDEKNDSLQNIEWKNAGVLNKSQTGSGAIALLDNNVSVQAVDPPRHVIIYHTHTDESYTPTSGQASEAGKGDVFQIGKALTDALNKANISVSHSLNIHEPHDINAYHRSRRTLTQLLKERPDAAFDIHRDSAPKSAYYTTINGVDISRVMIVVGRSNPNMQSNLSYAKTIKAAADEIHPGLMRGIFIGKGDYNQDLYPTALIFEVGTESISQDLAEKGVRCLADAIIAIMGR